jgi:hypothetical protein
MKLNLQVPISWSVQFQTEMNSDLEKALNRVNEYALVPEGGTAGQVLTKASARSLDLSWATPGSGVGSYLPLAGGSMTGAINMYSAPGGIKFQYPSLGESYSACGTVLANNAYVDPADTVSGQLRTINTHASYGHTIYELYGGNHFWYGNNDSVTSDFVVSKNQLMTLNYQGTLRVKNLWVNSDSSSASYITVGEPFTTRGDSQDGTIYLYGEQGGAISYAVISYSGSNLGVNSNNSGAAFQFAMLVDVTAGKGLQIRDSTNTDRMVFNHDGTDFTAAGTGTTHFAFSGVTDVTVNGTAVSLVGHSHSTSIRNVTGTTDSPTSADSENIVTLSSASATTVTLNSGVCAVGDSIAFKRRGAGTVTFSPGTSQSITSPGSRLTIPEQYGTVVATYLATNSWDLSGV